MKKKILDSGVVFVDETPVLLQIKGKNRCQQAYIWVYAQGGWGAALPVFRVSVESKS
jgi:transposase